MQQDLFKKTFRLIKSYDTVPALLPSPQAPCESRAPGVALVIKKRWCEEIFEGTKIWEIRGTPVKRRGPISIAQSKSKKLVGEVHVTDCLKVGRRENGEVVPWSDSELHQKNFIGAPENLHKHRVDDLNLVPYTKVYAWVLDKKHRYEHPKPYSHKKGCITWVKLDNSNRCTGTPLSSQDLF